MFSENEKEHYSRHLILEGFGEQAQQKLKNAKVLVVGAGGLGCPTLQYLAAAGIGNIGIIDHDTVSKSNLQRQVLFSYQDVGLLKVEVAKVKLNNLNPNITIKTYPCALSTSNALELFKQYDLIIDGTDNFESRYLINDAAVICNKPFVSASIYKYEGQIAVYNYKNSATYRCLFPEAPKNGEMLSCSEIGVLGVVTGLLGCLQANEVIKLICSIGYPLVNQLLKVNLLTLEQQKFSFAKNNEQNITALLKDYSTVCANTTTINEITFSELQNVDVCSILDVRTTEEFKAFNIGGNNIPLNQIKDRQEEISKTDKIVVLCKSGKRSLNAIHLLQKLGYKNLLNLSGGLDSIRS